jgi:hypothetical protein
MHLTKSKILQILLLLFSCGAFGYAFVTGRSNVISRISPTTIVVQANEAKNEKVSGKIDVGNQLGFDLELLRVSASCSCAVTQLPPGPLNDGGFLSIPFTIDLAGRKSDFKIVVALEYLVDGTWLGELIDIAVLYSGKK